MVPTRFACVLASALVIITAFAPTAAETPAVDDSPPRIFRFATDGFWLNLHHFLYVLGRVQAGMADIHRRAVAKAPEDEERGLAELSPKEQALWREAVAIYAEGPSQLDMVFDEQLLKTTHRLKDAESIESLEIDPNWKAALEKAEPLYRRAWWPEHQAANEAWVEAIEPLLEDHGEAVLVFLIKAYGQTWPEEGYPVQLSGYANWAGAYSTYGHLLVMSSLDDSLRGTLAGLEIVFHEAAHQFDSAVFDELIAAARAEGTRFNRGLDHALLFFTAGEAVRNAVSEYVPYAHAYGVWNRGMKPFLPALEAGWQPYLASEELGDEAARRAALRAVMRSLGETSEAGS